jgi:PIN domain nuclease of toxin-antitoxin system
MRILLDTHVLLWVLLEPDRIDSDTHAQLEDDSNEVLFSTATVWEIAIKFGLRRADFTVAPAEIAQAAIDTGFEELVIRRNAAALVADLPLLHRDPFDRILVAQAIVEPAVLLTIDHQLRPYSELVRLIRRR